MQGGILAACIFVVLAIVSGGLWLARAWQHRPGGWFRTAFLLALLVLSWGATGTAAFNAIAYSDAATGLLALVPLGLALVVTFFFFSTPEQQPPT
jgi:hypothetical protein